MEVTIKFYSQFMDKEAFNGQEPDGPFFGITFKSKKDGHRILPVAEIEKLSPVELAKAIKADCGLSGDMTQWVCAIVNDSMRRQDSGGSSCFALGGILKLQAVSYNDYRKEVIQ